MAWLCMLTFFSLKTTCVALSLCRPCSVVALFLFTQAAPLHCLLHASMMYCACMHVQGVRVITDAEAKAIGQRLLKGSLQHRSHDNRMNHTSRTLCSSYALTCVRVYAHLCVGVHVGDVSVGLKKHKNCFVGRECVAFMIKDQVRLHHAACRVPSWRAANACACFCEDCP